MVMLPAAVCRARGWLPGARLVVEDTAEGVLSKAASLFAATQPDAVFGRLAHDGPPMTLEEMDAAVLAETRRRNAGD